MSVRRFAAILATIAAAAFIGRAVYILAVTRHETGFYDRDYYVNGAINLAEGGGFKTPSGFGDRDLENAEHPPMTVLTLAPVARLTDNSETAMRFTVALAGIGVVILIGLIGREVVGARAGLIAAGVAAVYPNLWANDGLVMSETFATLGTAATVFCAYRLVREPTVANAAGAGVACGLAMLSRAELALFVPLLVLPATLMIAGLARARRLRLAGAVVLAASLTVAPWVGYNLSRFERPVLLSHGDGGVLFGANCDETYSGPLIGYWYGFCGVNPEPREHSVSAEQKRRRGLDYAGDHLDRVPVVVAARQGRVWGVYRISQMLELSESEGKPMWVSVTGWGMYWLLVALAVAGALRLLRGSVNLIPVLAPAVIVVLITAASYGAIRFRVPAEVSIVVLAAVTLDALVVRALAARRGEEVRAAPSSRGGQIPVA